MKRIVAAGAASFAIALTVIPAEAAQYVPQPAAAGQSYITVGIDAIHRRWNRPRFTTVRLVDRSITLPDGSNLLQDDSLIEIRDHVTTAKPSLSAGFVLQNSWIGSNQRVEFNASGFHRSQRKKIDRFVAPNGLTGNIVAVDGTPLPDVTIATDIDFKNALTSINAELQTITDFGTGDDGRWSFSVLAGLVYTYMELSYDLTNNFPQLGAVNRLRETVKSHSIGATLGAFANYSICSGCVLFFGGYVRPNYHWVEVEGSQQLLGRSFTRRDQGAFASTRYFPLLDIAEVIGVSFMWGAVRVTARTEAIYLRHVPFLTQAGSAGSPIGVLNRNGWDLSGGVVATYSF